MLMNTPSQASRRFWSIPNCAWQHTLGDVPITQTFDMMQIHNTSTRTKRGMPLGGIGAGNFMFNFCGSFGPWHFKPGRYEERFLSQAAFHVREEVVGQEARARTLATDDVLPGWQRLEKGDGNYFALFPRSWFTYDAFHTDISLQYFSPLIKHNYRESSFPVAHFLFKLVNRQQVPVRISVMFTFPNAPYTGSQNLSLDQQDGQGQEDQAFPDMRPWYRQATAALVKNRTGLINEAVSTGDLRAIVMKAQSQDNEPETQNTEWCIASTTEAGQISHTTAWDGAGDGGDIWSDFVEDGRLNDIPPIVASNLPAGALCVDVTLQPGEEKVIPFVLSWHFPLVEFGSGTQWSKRYTEYFPADAPQAFALAAEALQNVEQHQQAVEAWTQPIIESTLPDWLKAGGLNELYLTNFGGSFWENECVSKPKRFGGRPGQHLHFTMEAEEFRMAETFDVRHFASRSYRDLWPHIERDILLVYSDFILDSPHGECPHDAGMVDNDPFFAYDGYASLIGTLMPEAAQGWEKVTPWSEFSPKFIQQSHAYWKSTGDDEFLQAAWPAILRTYAYHKTTDTDGDGITEMFSSEYKDNRLFNGVLWIGALEALIEMADYQSDAELKTDAHNQLQKARAVIEANMWEPTRGYYQFNEQVTNLMADALIGHRCIDASGLRPTLNPQRLTSHYKNVFEMNIVPFKDEDGYVGAANLVKGVGSEDDHNSVFSHQLEVWTGVSYALAANMYHWGEYVSDEGLKKSALALGQGVYERCWLNFKTAHWFNTPEAWQTLNPSVYRNPMYQRARGIWELLAEVLNK